jgi:hypothetical protein
MLYVLLDNTSPREAVFLQDSMCHSFHSRATFANSWSPVSLMTWTGVCLFPYYLKVHLFLQKNLYIFCMFCHAGLVIVVVVDSVVVVLISAHETVLILKSDNVG